MSAAVPAPRPALPLARRRRLVALTYGGYLLCLALFALGWSTGVSGMMKAGAGLAPLSLIGMLALYGRGLGLPQPDRPGLDERQREWITWAYARAFGVTAALLSLVVFALVLTNVLGWQGPWPPLRDWASFLPTLLILVTGLPTALLAWTEPTLEEES